MRPPCRAPMRPTAGANAAVTAAWSSTWEGRNATGSVAFGLDDRYGSLRPGRVANVVVWSGDPFEFGTRAEHVFVRGREIVSPT